MKTTLLLLAIFMLSPTLASAWYCEKVSSEWMEKGITLQSCGIGYGEDENAARLDAFNNAKKEFENVCNEDSSCSNNIVNIDPQRTTCDKAAKGFVCHRLVYYHITDKKRQVVTKPSEPTVIEIKTVEQPTVINENNTNHIVIHKHYNTIKQATFQGKEFKPYRTYLRNVNGVSIYETNSRQYTGVHLVNPSDSEIDRAIKRGSTSGGMNAIYIHRN